jgi:DNA polymerase I-like protein with 3'-5' exonuclease and polymerase domains
VIRTTLIDRRNFQTELPRVLAAIQACTTLLGIDCETQDDARHDGLNAFMKVNEETRHKAKNKKLVFDMRRTVMTGFSLYPEGHDVAWYFNLGHSDVANRLTWADVQPILDAKPEGVLWVAHNATYELTAFASCFDYPLNNIVCTMQMSVSAFGDDNYDKNEFWKAPLGELQRHVHPLMMAALETTPQDLVPDDEDEQDRRFSRKVDEIIGKITSKTADSDGSYNGYVYDMAYGHGLKKLVKKFFGYDMSTFEETMDGNAHMGMLSGDEVSDYGAEDAYWVIPLFHVLMQELARNSPNALGTFFEQENPMVHVFSEIWTDGMRVNKPAIDERRALERIEFAKLLRDLKPAIRALLPSADGPERELAKRQDWYFNPEKPDAACGYHKYRKKWSDWANMPDSDDDLTQCMQVSSPVGNAWHLEARGFELKGKAKPELSITHYMPVRVLLYDLMRAKMMFDKGAIQSDGEARGKIQDWIKQSQVDNAEAKLKVIEIMTAMAGVEQRMKLYLTPYTMLTDPETDRMYPTVNCLLNTRRLAGSTPNLMQLAKRGESTYVRGFFLPDYDDHILVSLDWSAFELVIIGELSKDEEFHRAFGQLPHQDMHLGAAADIFRAELPWMTEEIFKTLKNYQNPDDFMKEYGCKPYERDRMFTNLKGESMTGAKAAKYWRTEIGKGANFNYWYSGFLTTVGQRMGWGLQRTGEATEFYRNRFWGAEQWRMDTIQHAEIYGYVELPDGHRRFRYEATEEWMQVFKAKWPDVVELRPIVHEIARRINKRAKNQAVNAMVQGTNAFVIKRSILRLKAIIKEMGWTKREANFKIPVHDEKVWSVHKDLVAEFITLARQVMMSHNDIFPTLKLDATPAVGLTFEPWNPDNPLAGQIGQIELFEAPKLDFLPESVWGGRLNDDQTRQVVDFLMHQRQAA